MDELQAHGHKNLSSFLNPLNTCFLYVILSSSAWRVYMCTVSCCVWAFCCHYHNSTNPTFHCYLASASVTLHTLIMVSLIKWSWLLIFRSVALAIYLCVQVGCRVICLQCPISSVGFDFVSLWFWFRACTLHIVFSLDRASLKFGSPLLVARVFSFYHYDRASTLR